MARTRLPVLCALAVMVSAVVVPASVSAANWYGTTLIGAPPTNPEPLSPNAFWERPDGAIWVTQNVARMGLWTPSGTHLKDVGSVSGTAPGQFQSPVAIAGTPDGSEMYVLDQGPRKVKRHTADGAYIGEWGTSGGAACQFSQPQDLDVAPDGTVLTIDAGSRWLNRWSADGSTCLASYGGGAAGAGAAQYSQPRGIAVDATGRIYVADTNNHRVKRLSPTGVTDITWGSIGTAPGQFTSPTGIDVDRITGEVYVQELGGRVQVFDADGVFQRAIGGAGFTDTTLITGQGIEHLSGGRIAVGDVASHRGLVWNDTTGAFVARLGTPPILRHTVEVAVHPVTNVAFIPASGEQRVRRVRLDGTELPPFGSFGSGAGEFSQPRGVAISPDGSQVYVADSVNNRIQRFDADGNYLGQFGGLGSAPGQMNAPRMLAVDPAGDVLVADTSNNRVQRFTADGTFISTFGSVGSGDSQFMNPSDVEVDATGTIWVSDGNNCKVKRFDPNGAFISAFSPCGSGPQQVTGFSDIGVAPDGTVWVNDTTGSRIVRFDATGAYIEQIGDPVKGTGSEQLNSPRGITVLADGSILVVDNSNMRVQRYRQDVMPPDVTLSATRGTGSVTVTALAVDAGAGLAAEAYSFDGGNTYQSGSSTTLSGLAADVSLTVSVVVRDRFGNVAPAKSIVVDRTPPKVTSLGVRTIRTGTSPTSARRWVDFVAGDDGSGMGSVTVTFGGTSVRVARVVDATGTFRFGPLPEGRGTLRIVALDGDGNERVIERTGIVVDYTAPTLSTPPRVVFGRVVKLTAADAVTGPAAGRVVRVVAPRLGRQSIKVTVRDRGGNAATRRVVVERRLSLARPSLNADLLDGVDYSLVNGSFAFRRNLPDWYRPHELARPLVLEAQRRLQDFGYMSVLHPKGKLDAQTITAVARFQADHRLPRIGTIGPRTRAALDAELLRRAKN